MIRGGYILLLLRLAKNAMRRGIPRLPKGGFRPAITVIIDPSPPPIIMGGREPVGAAGMMAVFANCPRPRPLATFTAYDRRAADISRSRGAARPFYAGAPIADLPPRSRNCGFAPEQHHSIDHANGDRSSIGGP